VVVTPVVPSVTVDADVAVISEYDGVFSAKTEEDGLDSLGIGRVASLLDFASVTSVRAALAKLVLFSNSGVRVSESIHAASDGKVIASGAIVGVEVKLLELSAFPVAK
jgi:hypothetical protein